MRLVRQLHVKSSAYEQSGNTLKRLPESQGHNLALTVLYVPHSLDGRGPKGNPESREHPARDEVGVRLVRQLGERVVLTVHRGTSLIRNTPLLGPY